MGILDRVASIVRLHNLFNKNDKIVVAVSGGADSVALLHILHDIALSQQLYAIYVDHGLRPLETPHEQKTIRDCCRILKIPYTSRSVKVHELVAESNSSLEEAARILRYKTLEEFRRECGAKFIAVGHTADDQVEEFFIRLIRGSGPKGLSGMRLKRDHVVRPLLFEKKESLVSFLADRNIPWCQDSSNLERQFLRNRVRLDLLPLLEEKFNPALRKTILQHMDILAEEDAFLNDQAELAYSNCIECYEVQIEGEKRLQLRGNLEKIMACHSAVRRRVMEKSFWRMGIRPTYEHIRTLIDFIATGRNGAELHLTDGVRAEKSAHNLFLTRPLAKGLIRGSRQPAPFVSQSIPGPGRYTVSETCKELILEEKSVAECREALADGELLIDRGRISFPLLLRSSVPGEKFYPYGSPGRKKISRYFNEQKIPQKNRPTWPVLVSADKVVALVGLQIDHNFRITSDTGKVLSIRWQDQ